MALSDTFKRAKSNPASTFLETLDIAQKTGANIEEAFASGALQNRLRRRSERDQGRPLLDESTVSDFARTPEPFGPQREPGEIQRFQEPEFRARRQILGQVSRGFDESEALDQANRELLRRKTIAESKATEDIDARIKELTSQSLVTKAILNDENKNLPPSQRRALVAGRLKVFDDTIDNLLQIRQKRMNKIDNETQENTDFLQSREQALATRKDMLEAAASQVDSIASNRDDAAMMRMSLMEAREQLQQHRKRMDSKGVFATDTPSDVRKEQYRKYFASNGAEIPITGTGKEADRRRQQFIEEAFRWKRQQNRRSPFTEDITDIFQERVRLPTFTPSTASERQAVVLKNQAESGEPVVIAGEDFTQDFKDASIAEIQGILQSVFGPKDPSKDPIDAGDLSELKQERRGKQRSAQDLRFKFTR